MTAFTLYHGKVMKSDSTSLYWIKESAMVFHGSKLARDVFILPRKV